MTLPTHINNKAAPGPVDWVHLCRKLVKTGERCVLIFVTASQGSAPREGGTWALVGDAASYGTLGGGEVERVVLSDARDLLAGRKPWRRSTAKFQLGPDLGQCCGGAMSAVMEPVDGGSGEWLDKAADAVTEGYVLVPLTETDGAPRVMRGDVPENLAAGDGVHVQRLADERTHVVVYGAGHVGSAISAIAAQLPVRLQVVDEREDVLADVPGAPNVRVTHRENAVSHARDITGVDAVLVMTHSHGLDYRLCQALTGRDDIAYIGLIGSATKAARFRSALAKEGFSPSEIERLTSPIGRSGPSGKEPGTIALAAWSEILDVVRGDRQARHPSASETKHV